MHLGKLGSCPRQHPAPSANGPARIPRDLGYQVQSTKGPAARTPPQTQRTQYPQRQPSQQPQKKTARHTIKPCKHLRAHQHAHATELKENPVAPHRTPTSTLQNARTPSHCPQQPLSCISPRPTNVLRIFTLPRFPSFCTRHTGKSVHPKIA